MGRTQTYEDIQNRFRSMEHLLYASKDVNFWEFTEEPPPFGSPETMECLYQAKDRKTGIIQSWPIDRATIQEMGSIEAVKKHIHSYFAESLVVLGRAVDKARLNRAGVLSARNTSRRGAPIIAHRRLEAGDHDH